MTGRTRVLSMLHIASCIAAFCLMWVYLSKFKEHLPDGIWDPDAMPGAAVMIVGMIAVILHLTHFIVEMSVKKE